MSGWKTPWNYCLSQNYQITFALSHMLLHKIYPLCVQTCLQGDQLRWMLSMARLYVVVRRTELIHQRMQLLLGKYEKEKLEGQKLRLKIWRKKYWVLISDHDTHINTQL